MNFCTLPQQNVVVRAQSFSTFSDAWSQSNFGKNWSFRHCYLRQQYLLSFHFFLAVLSLLWLLAVSSGTGRKMLWIVGLFISFPLCAQAEGCSRLGHGLVLKGREHFWPHSYGICSLPAWTHSPPCVCKGMHGLTTNSKTLLPSTTALKKLCIIAKRNHSDRHWCACWISPMLNNIFARHYKVIKNVKFYLFISRNLSFIGKFLTSSIREQDWLPDSQPQRSLSKKWTVLKGPRVIGEPWAPPPRLLGSLTSPIAGEKQGAVVGQIFASDREMLCWESVCKSVVNYLCHCTGHRF